MKFHTDIAFKIDGHRRKHDNYTQEIIEILGQNNLNGLFRSTSKDRKLELNLCYNLDATLRENAHKEAAAKKEKILTLLEGKYKISFYACGTFTGEVKLLAA